MLRNKHYEETGYYLVLDYVRELSKLTSQNYKIKDIPGYWEVSNIIISKFSPYPIYTIHDTYRVLGTLQSELRGYDIISSKGFCILDSERLERLKELGKPQTIPIQYVLNKGFTIPVQNNKSDILTLPDDILIKISLYCSMTVLSSTCNKFYRLLRTQAILNLLPKNIPDSHIPYYRRLIQGVSIYLVRANTLICENLGPRIWPYIGGVIVQNTESEFCLHNLPENILMQRIPTHGIARKICPCYDFEFVILYENGKLYTNLLELENVDVMCSGNGILYVVINHKLLRYEYIEDTIQLVSSCEINFEICDIEMMKSYLILLLENGDILILNKEIQTRYVLDAVQIFVDHLKGYLFVTNCRGEVLKYSIRKSFLIQEEFNFPYRVMKYISEKYIVW